MEETLLERAKALASEYRGVGRVALSYSGGLDSAVVGTLLVRSGFEVVPVAIDLGQQSDFSKMGKNARAMFKKFVLADAKDEYCEAIFRSLKGNYGANGSKNCGGISRPVMAHALVKAARGQKCQAIAHGSSGFGNDHLTMENSLRVLAPEMRIMAPVRDLDMRRDESVAFAKKERLPINLERAEKFSADEDLWIRSLRQGALAESGKGLPESAYKWTASQDGAPGKPAEIAIDFVDGAPVGAAVAGRRMRGSMEIIAALNEIGGKHGIGRHEGMDEKVVGLKIHEAYERPAAEILLHAHRRLEEATLTTRELDAKRQIDALWGRLVHDGGWHTRLRRCLDAYIDCASRPVEGTVRLRLYRGAESVVGIESRHALYDKRLSSRDSRGVFSQKEARHFAKLYGLQDMIAYLIDADS